MPTDPAYDLIAIPTGTRTRVAITLVISLAIVLTLVWLRTGGGTQFISPKFALTSYIADGTGLSRSSDVRLNGVPIGKVKHVALVLSHDPNRAIQVTMAVLDRFRKDVPVDSVAALTADNLLGDKFINIRAGKGMETVSDGSEIASLTVSGPFNPADLVASLQASLQSADQILTEIDAGQTPLAQFVKGHDLYDSLHSEIGAIHKFVDAYTDRGKPAAQLFFSDAYYSKLRTPILAIDRNLEQIQRGETPIGQFVVSPAMYDNFAGTVHNLNRSLADLNAGKGSGGEFLQSDQQYAQLKQQLNALNDAVDALTKGNGTFAQMLRTSQLYDSLAGQSQTTREFVKDFRENPKKHLRLKLF